MKVLLILLFPYIVDVVPELPPRVAPRALTSPTAGAATATAVAAIDNIDGTVAAAPPPLPPKRPGGVT